MPATARRSPAAALPDWRSDWTLGLVLLLACVACLLPFRTGAFERAFLADDFYYYAQIARNLATTGRSTFDGVTLTNGYHPLWLLALTLYWKLTAGGRGFFVLVNLTIVAGTLATYRLALALLTRRAPHTAFAALAAFWTAAFYLYFGRMGMEVVLTVPLALWLLRRWLARGLDTAWPGAVGAGLLASLLVLSRLDTALLLALLAAAYLLFGGPGLAQRLRTLLRHLPGMLPVPLYLLSNRLLFGTFGTASALAKHMKQGLWPSRLTLLSLFEPFGPGTVAFVLVAMALSVAGVLLLVLRPQLAATADARAVLAATLAFPWLYYLALAMTSGWRIFSWYDYALLLSALLSLELLHTAAATGLFAMWLAGPAAQRPLAFATLLLFALLLAGFNRRPQMAGVYADALALRSFAAGHPGIYAMGDRAGLTGFLLGRPLIQTEGLVMDRRMLADIRERRNLLAVLRGYGVRYYITADYRPAGGCFLALEPARSDDASAKMSATLCAAPIAYAAAPTTAVFDLRKELPLP